MILGANERTWLKKRYAPLTVPAYARTRVSLYRRSDCPCQPRELISTHLNRLTDDAIVAMLNLVAGTSEDHLDQTHVHVKLLDGPGGNEVGPEWLTGASLVPVSAIPLSPAPSAAVRWLFTDFSMPAYTVSHIEFWRGTASGVVSDDYNIPTNGYLFSEIDLSGPETKADGEAWDIEVTLEIYAQSSSLMTTWAAKWLANITGASDDHFTADRVSLLPAASETEDLAGDWLYASSATVDTVQHELLWLFDAPDGRFEGSWARTQVRHGTDVFRDGPCKADGASCGTKGSGESWEYGIAIYLADGGVIDEGRAPRINSFTADPVSVTQGETSRLSWNIEGTGVLTITLQAGSNAPVQIDSGPVSSMVVAPTATTSYVLQVTDDQMRADSASLTVAVDTGPRIVSFTAAPESITNGSSSTLRWETDNAATVTLQVGSATPTSVAVNGSQVESPTATTVYTLLATSASGIAVSETVTVNVGASGDPPTITSFTASALEVCSKSSVTLSWTTTDATALQLQQGSAAFATVTGTSTTISSLTETTTFTLKATNANSTEGVTKSLTVTVRPAAEIISFGATVSEVCANGPVSLRWQVRNATTVEFREGTDPWEETTATQKTVRPDEDTTYRLRATDECDNAVEEVFPVTVRPSPEINRFAASPSQVQPGGTANLTWAVSHATTVELRRSISDEYNEETIPFPAPPWEEWADVTGQSSLEATNITIARAYQLRVTNACGGRTSIEVIRVGDRPVCNYFYASRNQICSGSSLLLSWSVDNADSIELYTGDTSGTGSWASVSGSSMSVSPTADTVYSLRATNSSGTRVCGTFTVRVSTAAPTIDTFSAESTDVAPGTSVDLTYGVSNALTIELREGSAAWQTLRSEDVPFTVSGATVAVTVDEDTTYRLRARNECGSITSSVSVTITGALPVIFSLTAVPQSVADGGSTTVLWITTGATSLSIKLNDGAFAAVTGLSKVYTNLRVDTLFTLKATNTHGSVEETVQVIVCSKPVIHRFGAAPATITPGGGSDLTWRVTGQDGDDDDLTIDQGVGSVNNPIHEENGVRVTPTHTTTYTLTALNDCGAVTETATVTVDRSEADPVIHSFTANPETIASGDSSRLFWVVSAPIGGTITSLSIDQSVGSVLGADNADGVDVSPTATTTYTLTAKSSATNSTTATVTVTVAADTTPIINSFTADLTMITAGQYTVLRWNTSNATSLSLQTGSGTFDTVTGTNLDINPSSTTTYTLRATNGTNSVEAQVTVTVDQRPLIQSFTATPATVYPGVSGLETSTLAWMVSGATTLSITHVGTVTGTSVTVTPDATTEYRLTATNSHGNTSRNVTVFTSHLLF